MAVNNAPEVDPIRRNLFRLMFVGVAAGLVPATATVAGIKFLWGPKSPEGVEIRAGNVNDYEVGDVRLFGAGEFYLIRVDEGFLAINQRSTHMRCKVVWKASSREFVSSCDGSIFDDKGEVIRGPASRPLGTHRIRADGGELLVLVGDENVLKRDEFKREQVYSLG